MDTLLKDYGRGRCFDTIKQNYKSLYNINVEPCEYRNISVCAETVGSNRFSIIVSRSDIGDYVRVPLAKWYRQRQVTVTTETSNGPVHLTFQVDRVSSKLVPLQKAHKNAGKYELTIALDKSLPKTVKIDVDIVDGPRHFYSQQTKQRGRRSIIKRQPKFRKFKTKYHGLFILLGSSLTMCSSCRSLTVRYNENQQHFN